MTVERHSALERELRSALGRLGVPDALVDAADELVLFGSRAAGVNRPESDWDVLLVADKRPPLLPGADLLCVPRRRVETREWLESELANHIAAFGLWLSGTPSWRNEVRRGSACAVERKSRAICDRIAMLAPDWHLLSRPFRSKYLTLIRRDMQRLIMMTGGQPVPPTPVLDATWREHGRVADYAARFVTKDVLSGATIAALSQLETTA